MRAHEAGIIHFHDTDYFAQKEHNCDLINLEDMLQNGTVISETMIEAAQLLYCLQRYHRSWHRWPATSTADSPFSLAHLAPFVDISRQKLRKNVIEEAQGVRRDSG